MWRTHCPPETKPGAMDDKRIEQPQARLLVLTPCAWAAIHWFGPERK
jgi:hypothetical protein